MKRRKLELVKTLGMLCAVFFLLTISSAVAMEAPYPNKLIRLIVPYPPGGGNDIVARLIAGKLSQRLGQQIIVDNRGGANTIMGTEQAAKAKPDGYTLLMVATAFTTNPSLQELPYDSKKDFAPVAKLATGANGLFVHPSVPANTVKEFITLAKQKPGKLVFASGGNGGGMHMSEELFKIMTGVDIKIVQFKGNGPASIDLLGGHSDAAIGMLLLFDPYIKNGTLKVLGTSGTKRSSIMPDVPTIAEAGVSGYEFTGWYGLVAPAGVPAPIVNRLTSEIKGILAMDEVKKTLLEQGAEADYQNPADFTKYLNDEMAKFALIVKKANIKMEK